MDEAGKIQQDELQAEGAEELPAREAVSVMTPSPGEVPDDFPMPLEHLPLKGGEEL